MLKAFELLMVTVIVANMIVLAVYHYGMSREMRQQLDQVRAALS